MRQIAMILVACSLGLTCCKNTPDDERTSASESVSEPSPAPSPEPAGTSPCPAPDVSGISAQSIAGQAFDKPVYLTQPPGENEKLYVVERAGRILVVEDGEVLDEPFLDIRERVGTGHTERGLLGLAFHPEYQKNGRFFIYYTPEAAHKNVAAEWSKNDGEAREVRRLIEPEDPEDNHNGGMITFGPDGYLWVGMGDGGGAGDRHGDIGNGQNIETLFASILRLDVDAPERGFAAEGNPFVGEKGRDQIWAYGLRNPWRFSFDRETGALYIGDVGQNEIEEVSWAPADAEPGRNYGWRAYEGNAVFDEELTKLVLDHAAPIVTFEHRSEDAPIRGGCSITGGYVYRGDAAPGLQGAYIYGDYCSMDVAAFRYCNGEVVGHQRIPGLHAKGQGLGSFGEDNAGNVYLLYHAGGQIKRIVAE